MASQSKLKQLISGDMGYGMSTFCNGIGEEVTFRSIVAKCEPGIANYSDKTGHYLVGDKAVSYSNQTRNSTDTRYFSSNEIRVITMYGLKQLGAKNPYFITGLPNEFFDEIKPQLQKYIRSFDEYLNGDQFNKIFVVRQPSGTVWNKQLVNLDGEHVSPPLDKRVAVIDGGDGTTDISEFYQGLIVPESSNGLSIGGSQIHNSLLSFLRQKGSVDSGTSVHDIDKAIKEGTILFNGVDTDPKTLKGFKDGVANYCSQMEGIISEKWKAFNKIEHVILTGGIVSLIGVEELTKRLKLPKSKVLYPSSPSSANAFGYMEFLKSFLNSKGLL